MLAFTSINTLILTGEGDFQYILFGWAYTLHVCSSMFGAMCLFVYCVTDVKVFMLTYISYYENVASFEVVFLLLICLINYIYFKVVCFLLLQFKSLSHLLWQLYLKIKPHVFPDKCLFGSSRECVLSFSSLAKPG